MDSMPHLHLLIAVALDVVGVYILATCLAELYVYAAKRKNRDGDTEAAVRMLERLLRFGMLVPAIPRLTARYSLVCWHVVCGHFETALDLADRLLSDTTTPAMRSDLLRRRSECLLGLNRPREAEQSIADAGSALKTAGQDRAELYSRAVLLFIEGELSEAYDLYRRVLELTPLSARDERDLVLGKLATTAQLSGRGSEICRWADQLIAETKNPQFRAIGYRMAAVGCADTGDHAGAERYCRDGIAVALAAKRNEDAVQTMAYLASLLRNRPSPHEAMALIDQALALHPKERYQLLLARSETFIVLGQFVEAAQAARDGHDSVAMYIPSGRRKIQAIMKLAEARPYQMLGDAERSQRLLDEAASVLTDAKMTVWCKAMSIMSVALRGDRARWSELTSEVLAGILAFPDANDIKQTVFSNACRSSALLCLWDSCARHANSYLSLNLSPADYAMPHYHLGLSARAEGDSVKAKAHFERAAEVHPEFYYSRLAREALDHGTDAGI